MEWATNRRGALMELDRAKAALELEMVKVNTVLGLTRPPAKPTRDEQIGGKGRKPGINARMLQTIQKNMDAAGWSSPKWAKHLKSV